MKNSDESEDVTCQTFQTGWQFTLGGDEKGSQDLLIFRISNPKVLVLLEGRLFLRQRSFSKPTWWDFARTVTQG